MVRDGARDGRRDRHAVDAAARRQRGVRDRRSTVAVLVLLELADDQRAEVGQRRLRPVDVRRSGRPACQSRSPTKSKPEPWNRLAMVADRELAHPLEDDQLDLGDVRQVDERRAASSWSPVVLMERAPGR